MEIYTENQAIETIMRNEVFIKTSGVLASKLHIELKDARHLLLTNLWEHRFHGTEGISETLTPKQTRDIIFARKDIERAMFSAENAHMKLFVSSEDEVGNSLVENVADSGSITTSYSEAELERVLILVPTIFTKNSQEFVTVLLTQGEETTKEKLDLTTKRFNGRLKQLEVTLSEGHIARRKADMYLKSDKQIREEANVQQCHNLIELLEQDTPQAWVQMALRDTIDNEYFDKAWDAVRFPPRMIRDWNETPQARQDGYKFISELHKLINE